VYVNGRRAGEGFDIFFAQEFDVTDWVRFGAENQILVKVVSPKVFDQRGPYGRREYLSGSFWGTHIAGIWQDVFFAGHAQGGRQRHIRAAVVNQDELRIEATVANHSATSATVNLSGNVREWLNQAGKSVLDAPEVKWKLAASRVWNFPARKSLLRPANRRRSP